MRVGERVLGIISTLILARLLVPEDYGIIAMATVVIAFMETLTATGVDTVIISKQHVDESDYNTAWTINVLIGLGLCLIIVALAHPAADFFQTPELARVLAVFSLLPLLYGLENIGTVDFRRNLQFDRDVRFVLGKKLIGLFTTVPLAFLWRNHWALVVGLLSLRAGGVILSYVMSPFRPRFSIARFREYFGFSKWLALQNFLVFLRLRSTDLLTGRLHGPGALGVFAMANELASIPSTELVMPVNRALFPGYSRMATDFQRLRAGFARAVGMVSLLAIPASVGLAVVADDAVPLMLGGSWLATIPVIQLLAIAGVSTALQISCWSVFMATQRFSFLVYLNLFHLAVMVPAMFVFVPPQGAVGAALAHLVACIASLPVAFAMVRMVIGLPVAAFFHALWRPTLASAFMFGAVEYLGPGGLPPDSAALVLLAGLGKAVAVGAAVYATVISMLWLASGKPGSAESEVLDYLRRLANRVRGSGQTPNSV